MNLEAFELRHLESFDPGPYDARAMKAVGLESHADSLVGKAVAIVEAGRTLGVTGISLEDDGTPLGWAVLSDDLRRRPKQLHFLGKRVLPGVMAGEGLTSLDVLIYRSFGAARRWAERLGFELVRDEPFGQARYRLMLEGA